MKKTTPQKHHPFGFSSLYRRKECPGSYLAEDGKEEESGPYAEEGELLHDAVWQTESDKEKLHLTDEQKGCVSVCNEWLESFDGWGMGEEWHAEETLSLFDANGDEILFGTPDAFKFLPERKQAANGDWKFGFVAVDSPELNFQMAVGSAAIMQNYGDKYDLSNGVESCIIQPRIRTVNHPVFVYRNCAGIVTTVQHIIDRCKDINAPRVAGSHCTYCLARTTCHAFGAFETSLATLNPTAVTEENIEFIVTACTQMGNALERARSILKGMVRASGGRYGNVILKEKLGNRGVSTSYHCKKCDHSWTGTQVTDGKCVACKSTMIVEIGGGAMGLYNSMSNLVSSDEFVQRCRPQIQPLEDLVASKLLQQQIVTTKAKGREMFSELDAIVRANPSEVLKIVKGEE